MKRITLIMAVIASLLVAGTIAIPVVALSGCTSTQQSTTLKTLTSVHVATDNTYKAYLDVALTDSTKTNGVPTATRAYREFQAAYNLALTAVAFNTNAPAPQSVLDAASKVTTTVKSVK